MSNLRLLGVAITVIGAALSVASLLYGDSIVAGGLPCQTTPLAVPGCSLLLILFWIGIVCVVLGLIVTLYWRFFRFGKV